MPQLTLAQNIRLSRIGLRDMWPVWMLFFLGILEFAWAYSEGYTFSGLTLVCAVVFFLSSISLGYGLNGRSKSISDMAYYSALWVVFSATGAIFTYLTATFRLPLLDGNFTAIDAALGFHWLDWYNFLRVYPHFNVVLRLAYSSGVLQIFVSIIYFSHIGKSERNDELWWAAAIALLLTAIISGFLPAAGAFYHFGVGLKNAVYLPHLFALRDGNVMTFAIPEMQGIVAFPSYHTVLAILLIYAFRGQRFWFVVVSLLNVLMLLSTPTYGGHYLVDMISGSLVAALAIYSVRRMPGVLREDVMSRQEL